ncbi:hypothetical protein BGZ70_005203 [Mortierella alpina]|uniref:Uncharacterized protein n=1 Tax=Mortierella alpina TaxID=64518 RepID=A0A9P6J973_MORAP|nr:hypothetical protein BGZ70_005203 [Mortierella alpina]
MDTEHSNKVPPPLPAKLRWRPYANGSSKKNSKPKKDDARPSQPSAKAVASKVRGKQYYSGKTPNPPVEVKLQWEEAETIESMSHGGHPHNQPHSHSQQQISDSESDSSRSRGPSPGASSVNSSSSLGGNTPANKSDNGSNNTSGNPFSNAMRRAMASLPSPPPSKMPTTTTRVDLVGGQSDLSQFRASIPELGCNTSPQYGLLPLDLLESSSAYQIALSALFQSQSLKTPESWLYKYTNNAAASTLLGSSSIKGTLFPEPNGVLSNQELLDVSTIDELLASCGYVDNIQHAATHMLSSPADTDQSFTSSPLGELLNFGSSDFMSRGSSPSSSSFSPMAVASTGVDALLTQPMNLLPAGRSSPVAATGTDGPYVPPPSPVSAKSASNGSQHGSPESLFGLSDEELDPDWLSFLDEASPLFNEVDMPSPPPSGDDSSPKLSPNVKSTQRDRSMWSWAEELLKPGAQTPIGHRGLPSAAPGMTGMPGSLGSGGLIRTLQGTGQQRVHKPAADSTKSRTEARSPDEESEDTSNEATAKREQDAKSTTAAKAKQGVSSTGLQDKKLQPETKEDGAFGGLVAMLRNLWVGKGGGDNDKS